MPPATAAARRPFFRRCSLTTLAYRSPNTPVTVFSGRKSGKPYASCRRSRRRLRGMREVCPNPATPPRRRSPRLAHSPRPWLPCFHPLSVQVEGSVRVHRVVRRWCVGTALAGCLAGSLAGAEEHRPANRADTVLYVWAGDQARVAPDFLAVIDFDEDSRTYGKGPSNRADPLSGECRQ